MLSIGAPTHTKRFYGGPDCFSKYAKIEVMTEHTTSTHRQSKSSFSPMYLKGRTSHAPVLPINLLLPFDMLHHVCPAVAPLVLWYLDMAEYDFMVS